MVREFHFVSFTGFQYRHLVIVDFNRETKVKHIILNAKHYRH